MAIDPNVLLRGIVPDAVGAASRGFDLGNAIRNAPLLRKQKELELKKLEQGGGLASATTTTWKNGTTLFNLPNGSQRLVFQGREITDPAEIDRTIKAANKSGVIQAGNVAFAGAEGRVLGGASGGVQALPQTTKIEEEEAAAAAKGSAEAKIAAEESDIDAKANREAKLATSAARAKKLEERNQLTIQAGLSAAPQLFEINRGLELIEQVTQGGIAKASKVVTDFFGTTSGEVGELNRILAGQVLAGLAAFTGAISEGERAFVEKMEGSLGSGKEVNKAQLNRLKRIYTNSIKKSVKLAKEQDDFNTLSSIKIDLGDSELARELFKNSGNVPTITTKEEFDALPKGAVYQQSDGQRFTK